MSNVNRSLFFMLRLCAFALLFVTACIGTETGNPPVVRDNLVKALVRGDKLEIVGDPGAVLPGGSTFVVLDLDDNDKVLGSVVTQKDGSFQLVVDNTGHRIAMRADHKDSSSTIEPVPGAQAFEDGGATAPPAAPVPDASGPGQPPSATDASAPNPPPLDGSASAPNASASGASTPGASTPGASVPGANTPGANTPDISAPGASAVDAGPTTLSSADAGVASPLAVDSGAPVAVDNGPSIFVDNGFPVVVDSGAAPPTTPGILLPTDGPMVVSVTRDGGPSTGDGGIFVDRGGFVMTAPAAQLAGFGQP